MRVINKSKYEMLNKILDCFTANQVSRLKYNRL